MSNKKQTAVEWLENEIDQQQKRYIDLAKKDKSIKKEVDAILTATTLLKMKCEQSKEVEKKQHYETWFESTAQFSNEAEMLYKKDFEQYYNETFKNK